MGVILTNIESVSKLSSGVCFDAREVVVNEVFISPLLQHCDVFLLGGDIKNLMVSSDRDLIE